MKNENNYSLAHQMAGQLDIPGTLIEYEWSSEEQGTHTYVLKMKSADDANEYGMYFDFTEKEVMEFERIHRFDPLAEKYLIRNSLIRKLKNLAFRENTDWTAQQMLNLIDVDGWEMTWEWDYIVECLAEKEYYKFMLKLKSAEKKQQYGIVIDDFTDSEIKEINSLRKVLEKEDLKNLLIKKLKEQVS